MNLATRRVLLTAGLIAVAAVVLIGGSTLLPRAVASSPTPLGSPTASATVTPSPIATRSPTPGPAVRPVGYELPSECTYLGEAERRDSTNYWLIKCPVGLLTRALGPSLAAQSWENCDTAGGITHYRKGNQLIVITNFVNRSDATGELGERIRTGACG